MGKKVTPSSVQLRHDPLATQIRSSDASGILSAPGRRRQKARIAARQNAGVEDGEGKVIDPKISRKILGLAKEQQDEVEAEEMGSVAQDRSMEIRDVKAAFDDDEDEEYEVEEMYEEDEGFGADYAELDIDEGDNAILDSFMPGHNNHGGSTNLADLVMAKIAQQESGMQPQQPSFEDRASVSNREFDPKVIEVYTKVGQLLSRYKSGPLPKAFKILPTVSAWPPLLLMTQPENWTPHALLAATKIFTSTLEPKQCQIFFNKVLLEKIRDEIQQNKKLSVQSYEAIKKSMYKPQAFFKGVLFPLCESGTCTLREAAIMGSVLTRVSIPVLHSGAALLKLAEMDYTGPNSLFIRVLLDKKYALPYKVVDALVYHFMRFKRDTRTLPVLWHQSFLVFVQRYKQDLTDEQKEALLDTIKVKMHSQISPEIRRELVNAQPRDDAIPLQMAYQDEDVLM